MFTSRRFLQIHCCTHVLHTRALGLVATLLLATLAACSSAPRNAEQVSGAAPAATAGGPEGNVTRIRIGPSADQASASSIGSEPADANPADVSSVRAPTGQLRPEVQAFAQELASRNGLAPRAVLNALSGARYSATAARLIAPAPGRKITRSWVAYRTRMVDPKRIRWGAEFWGQNIDTLQRAQATYGVPASIIVAIIGVETLYGRNMGDFSVLNVLTTLAFDYPDPSKPERAAMFREQLGDFLLLVLQGRLPLDTVGSYAGAVGMPQFMPSSIMQYAVAGAGGGPIDLTGNPADAILSVANYLHAHGWLPGVPVFAPVQLPPDAQRLVDGGLAPTLSWPQLVQAGASARAPGAWQDVPLGVIDLPEEAAGTVEYRTATPNFYAITQYNHSYFYATAVADLAATLQRQQGGM
jgi:membrane-bound lytic murein transglycosylase B